MGLDADLKDFSVSEVLFLLSHYKKSGRLHVRGPEKEGDIFLLEGNAVHATQGSLTGVEAIYNISLELSGSLAFDPLGETKERTVSESADKLVAEGEHRRLELKDVLTKLPPFETLLVRTPHPPEQTAITIPPHGLGDSRPGGRSAQPQDHRGRGPDRDVGGSESPVLAPVQGAGVGSPGRGPGSPGEDENRERPDPGVRGL